MERGRRVYSPEPSQDAVLLARLGCRYPNLVKVCEPKAGTAPGLINIRRSGINCSSKQPAGAEKPRAIPARSPSWGSPLGGHRGGRFQALQEVLWASSPVQLWLGGDIKRGGRVEPPSLLPPTPFLQFLDTIQCRSWCRILASWGCDRWWPGQWLRTVKRKSLSFSKRPRDPPFWPILSFRSWRMTAEMSCKTPGFWE